MLPVLNPNARLFLKLTSINHQQIQVINTMKMEIFTPGCHSPKLIEIFHMVHLQSTILKQQFPMIFMILKLGRDCFIHELAELLDKIQREKEMQLKQAQLFITLS
jgi:hypothetical protein